MTNREAALKSCKDRLEHLENAPSHHYGKRQRQRAIELEKVKIEALRPVTREQVDKVFPGCRSCKSCRSCVFSIHATKDMPCKKCDPNAEGVLTEYKPSNFCPVCGKPLTDEAVDMVMERLEALHETV